MDIEKNLILIREEDRTDEIESFSYAYEKYHISFYNNVKVYTYNTDKVQYFQIIEKINPQEYNVKLSDNQTSSIETILNFGEYYKIIYQNGKVGLYKKEEVCLQKNYLNDVNVKRLFEYYKEVAHNIGLETNGKNILESQYEKIKTLSDDSILLSYLLDNFPVSEKTMVQELIYPFGINQSQKNAVENAFSSRASIVQGPPGTGKTQTILNILVNIICLNKSVAVVSNNNSATYNVLEKLKKNGLDFLAAFLGCSDNKKLFIESQDEEYPDMIDWELSENERKNLLQEIITLTNVINEMFNAKNRLAAIEQEFLSLTPEEHYFNEYYTSLKDIKDFSLKNLSFKKVLGLWLDFEKYAKNGTKLNLLQKIVVFFRYNNEILNFFSNPAEQVIPYLQKEYYHTKIIELNNEKEKLTKLLESDQFTIKLKELTEKSMCYFKAILATRYTYKEKRQVFSNCDFESNAEGFIQEYPIILSTTHSIKNSLSSTIIYDYLIIDEASQVDLVTGVLALSCAKNIIIVGDKKQLPNVISNEHRELVGKIERQYNIKNEYLYTQHSILSSLISLWKDIPTTLLREHYRCHPRIINFCNQKFYNGQLIIMTEDKGEKDVLSMIRTVAGNHAFNHQNQRQIEVIKQEVLPELSTKNYQSIGIIAPYRKQVLALSQQLDDKYEIDTVHKFQGREQDAIILSSVDNKISEFVDDPKMLNVAVSRAVKSLTVVISPNEENIKTNYGDLARYIEFNRCELKTSKIRSVFDLLYKDYGEEREKFLAKNKKISQYDSENIIYKIIQNTLEKKEFLHLGCRVHVSLATIFKDLSILNDEEKKYVKNPFSHTDFLIINKMDKLPIVAIEVDGISYHNEATKQFERDKIKNSVFEKYKLPLLRLSTKGSNEQEKLENLLFSVTMNDYSLEDCL